MADICINEIGPLTEEKRKEIESLKNREIVFDDDCPESTPAMLKAFELAANMRDRLKAN